MLREQLDRAEQTGGRPSVLALARHFGLSNTTFRRHFPSIASEIGTARTTPPPEDQPRGASRYDRLVERNAKLRRANRDLSDHIKLAAAHIQRLALENARLTQRLEAASKVTRIDTRSRHRT
ncbi:hypothetical protein GCM10029976_067190 [Kribbella albertanoniae]|uniref:Uncharacterized protein n=1 Tax=Kribbella albertanoniae TaxID=1266829 RepID=A0A4R4QJ49_9ACTN|nr:hypothetical protein [Kribbella albertanoniae]TDC35826.1 hypothetical protein E1261_00435 [Kribbella albertanoniae]